MKRLTLDPCRMCGGSGKLPSSTTGSLMRTERESHNLSREAVAAHFYKPDNKTTYAPSYLQDLEADKRAWSMRMVGAYRLAITNAVKARNGSAK